MKGVGRTLQSVNNNFQTAKQFGKKNENTPDVFVHGNKKPPELGGIYVSLFLQGFPSIQFFSHKRKQLILYLRFIPKRFFCLVDSVSVVSRISKRLR